MSTTDLENIRDTGGVSKGRRSCKVKGFRRALAGRDPRCSGSTCFSFDERPGGIVPVPVGCQAGLVAQDKMNNEQSMSASCGQGMVRMARLNEQDVKPNENDGTTSMLPENTSIDGRNHIIERTPSWMATGFCWVYASARLLRRPSTHDDDLEVDRITLR